MHMLPRRFGPGAGKTRDYNGKEVNGKEVDQGIARKAQQEPEGEMEGTETIELLRRIWHISEEEEYWYGRGNLAEVAAIISAAHSEYASSSLPSHYLC